MKICQRCQEELPEVSFWKSRCRSDALHPVCKNCENTLAKDLYQLHKIAPIKPNNCQCCGKESTNLVLDHDHNSMELRGWICRPCNTAIGKLGDNIEGLMKAVEYLTIYEITN